MPSQTSLRNLDSTIASFGGPTFNGTNVSLAGTEIHYMGSNPGIGGGNIGNIAVSKVCMVNQKEGRVTQPGWDPTQSVPDNTGTWPWYYVGNTVAWRPARMSEFDGARDIRGLGIGAVAIPTGWDYPYGDIGVSVGGGRAPYFVYSVTDGSWAGPVYSYYQFRANNGYLSTLYIVDYDGCGGNFDAPTVRAHYP